MSDACSDKSNTPRTDAEAFDGGGSGLNTPNPKGMLVRADVARQLERELEESEVCAQARLEAIVEEQQKRHKVEDQLRVAREALAALASVPSSKALTTDDSFVPWDLEAVKQEIRDLFARYGSGQYMPTEQEKEIIEAGLDEILTPPPTSSVSATLRTTCLRCGADWNNGQTKP